MAVLSKHGIRVVNNSLPCSVLHPWTTSCTHNSLGAFLQTVRGSSKFFFALYLFQLGLKVRSWNHDLFIHQLVIFCKSCLFTGFCAGSSVGTMCFLRWLMGKHTKFCLGLIPGFVGGGGIFIEDRSRRTTDLTILIALVTNLYLKILEDEKLFSMTVTKEFLIFMVCSSLLLYCLRVDKDSFTTLWPFTPHKIPKDLEMRKQCPHKGACLDYIKREGWLYFSYGFSLQIIKNVILNAHKIFFDPRSFLQAFFTLNNLRLPVFSGLYVSVFKGVSCLLRHCREEDEAWHSLLAGVVASLSYFIRPNITLTLMAFSNLSQVLCRKYKSKLQLPEWPWEEFISMICMGLLYHARAAYPKCFPKYMFTIMDSVTDGRAQTVYNLAEEHLISRY